MNLYQPSSSKSGLHSLPLRFHLIFTLNSCSWSPTTAVTKVTISLCLLKLIDTCLFYSYLVSLQPLTPIFSLLFKGLLFLASINLLSNSRFLPLTCFFYISFTDSSSPARSFNGGIPQSPQTFSSFLFFHLFSTSFPYTVSCIKLPLPLFADNS